MTTLHPARRVGVPAVALLAATSFATFGCSPATPGDPPLTAATPWASAGASPDPARLHAVLVNGGGRRQINYHSHLDHLRRMLDVLEASGVDPARISIFSADGADPAADLATRSGDLPGDFWLLPRSEAKRLRPPIVYVDSQIPGFALRPATREALRAWFDGEGSGLASGDTLLFYVTDHGEKNGEDPTDNTIVLWGEDLSVRELRELLTRLDPGVRVVMLMSQCYSGGFANVIFSAAASSSPDGRTCGYFSAPADRKAHGCYPEVSGKETTGHSYRMFEALASARRLPEAQREVLVTDDSPDVPHATSSFLLAQRVEREAERAGHETPEFVDGLLAEAWEDPPAWEPEIRLIDRIGETFGFASPRSLVQLEAHAEDLSELREQLDTYSKRWNEALDALRRENWVAFQAAHPAWRQRVSPHALGALEANARRRTTEELLRALSAFAEQYRDYGGRLRELRWKAEEAKAARYRADVRLAAVLRARALLTDVAGRTYLARHAPVRQRAELAQLEACEDLALVPAENAVAPASPPSEPLPTLAEEQRRIAAILPGWLGVHYRAPSTSERTRHGPLPSGASVVSAVLPDSPAAAADLRIGDIVLGPPDAPFRERHAMREWVMQGAIGEPLRLRILRDARERGVTVHLAAYPLVFPALPAPPRLGSAAPRLEPGLEYLSAARPPRRGRSRLFFFWASWCEPCKRAIPELMAFSRARDVPVVAISDEDPEDVRSFVHRHDGPLPEILATDPRRVSFESYGVSGTPTFVLLDAEGIVRHYATGYDVAQGLGIDGWRWDGRVSTN